MNRWVKSVEHGGSHSVATHSVSAQFDVVIAARDEAQTVAAVVRAACAARGVGRVIVADDGSLDSTAEVARAAGAHVVAVRSAGEPGHKGQALAAGVAATTAPRLVFFDADLHGVEPQHFEALIEPIDAGRAADGRRSPRQPIAKPFE